MKKKLQEFIKEMLYYYDLPGLGVVVKKGSFLFQGVEGYFDYPKKKILKEEDIFHLASMAKLFTSAAILKLCDQGKLQLEDRLTQLLPWLEIRDPRGKEITLKQVLSHTSGLGDLKEYHWDTFKTHISALKEYGQGDEVKNVNFHSNPGDNEFLYSNIGYELLGCVIGEQSGKPFETYVEEEIFRPLGMKNSSFLTFERDKEALVLPHRKNREKHIVYEPHYPYTREHAPSSTLTMDLKDLHTFGQSVLEQRLFSSSRWEEIWTPVAEVPNNKEKIGLGWFLREQQGRWLMGHEGADVGFRSSFWVCPEQDGYVGVLTNLSKGPAKRINKALWEKFIF